MRDRTLLDNAGVAARLSVTKDWWLRNKARLMRELGFPAEVKGIPQRWDPAAIDAWLNRQCPLLAPVLLTAEAALPANDGQDWERRLMERLEGAGA